MGANFQTASDDGEGEGDRSGETTDTEDDDLEDDLDLGNKSIAELEEMLDNEVCCDTFIPLYC